MKSLKELCEIELKRNYRSINDVSRMPFYLIEPCLKLMKPEQLESIEKKSPLLVLEDDHIWLNHLQNDFPTNGQDMFTSKKNTIEKYYTDFINENIDEIDRNCWLFVSIDELVNRRMVQLVKRENGHWRTRIPYRKIYLRYKDDEIKKQEISAEKLRLQMQQIKKEREEKQTITVGSEFFNQNYKRYGRKTNETFFNDGNRSKLFIKSMKENANRSRIFQGPRHDFTPIPVKNRDFARENTRIVHAPSSKVMGYQIPENFTASHNNELRQKNNKDYINTNSNDAAISSRTGTDVSNLPTPKLSSTMSPASQPRSVPRRLPLKRQQSASPSIFLKKKKKIDTAKPYLPSTAHSPLSKTNIISIKNQTISRPTISQPVERYHIIPNSQNTRKIDIGQYNKQKSLNDNKSNPRQNISRSAPTSSGSSDNSNRKGHKKKSSFFNC